MIEGTRRASAENVPLRAGEPWQAEASPAAASPAADDDRADDRADADMLEGAGAIPPRTSRCVRASRGRPRAAGEAASAIIWQAEGPARGQGRR